jgi:hypothetical protein
LSTFAVGGNNSLMPDANDMYFPVMKWRWTNRRKKNRLQKFKQRFYQPDLLW